jgi:molybdate transport system ATP-binding protein
VARAAAAVGVTGLLGRSFLTLSRGEARRTLVARALAPEPDALLLDEVCDGLDAAARADLLARLSALPRRVAIVTATHRAEEIFPGITRVLWLEGGRVVASGPPAEVVPRWRAAFGARPSAASRERPARRRIAAMAAPGLAPVFALRGVTVLVEGRAILDRVTWRVGPGEAWAVTGPNGAGKSTLLRLLAGDEQPARGTIRRLGLGLHADATALRARLGVVSPELQARHRNDASGLEVVLSGYQGSIGLARRPLAGERAGAAAALARLGLARLARRRFLGCSYGEQRLLLLARALAPDPEVLLLDEPFAGLDPGARARLGRIVGRLARAGTGLVLVTHHEDEVPGAVTHRARLEAGRLVVTP